MQEHAAGATGNRVQPVIFSIADLRSALDLSTGLASSQASTPWQAVRDVVMHTTHGPALEPRDQAVVAALAELILAPEPLQAALQGLGKHGLPSLGSSVESFK